MIPHSAKNSNRKTRAWGAIYYPESPDDATIFDLLEQTHVPALVSPLHDSDVFTATDEAKNSEHRQGKLKKIHYHVMVIFDGPARESQARTVFATLGDRCTQHIEPISSISAMTRYFVHLDNPDKFQYNIDDIASLNGASISLQKQLTPEEVSSLISIIIHWIKDTNCLEYSDLIDFAISESPDWMQVVCNRTIFFTHYLASRRAKMGIRSAKNAE